MKATRTLLFRVVLMLALVWALPVFGVTHEEIARELERDPSGGDFVAYGLGGILLISVMYFTIAGAGQVLELVVNLFKGKPKA